MTEVAAATAVAVGPARAFLTELRKSIGNVHENIKIGKERRARRKRVQSATQSGCDPKRCLKVEAINKSEKL